jgi:two-component system KDP operon response regulator KdpE
LILLDLCLPDMDGKEVLRRLRAWTSTPVVVMSVRHLEAEKIACLDAGADDFLTKPFTMGELLARLRAVLRRAFGASQGESFKAGALRVDFNRREVFVGEEKVNLSATEYDLLKVLVHHAGLVRTHHQLIHELWGGTHYQDSVHLLRVTVSNLRRKLACDPRILRYIVTEPGVGYRLRTDADWALVRENL